jgi:hypothetical protein
MKPATFDTRNQNAQQALVVAESKAGLHHESACRHHRLRAQSRTVDAPRDK